MVSSMCDIFRNFYRLTYQYAACRFDEFFYLPEQTRGRAPPAAQL